LCAILGTIEVNANVFGLNVAKGYGSMRDNEIWRATSNTLRLVSSGDFVPKVFGEIL
jgi:hypothetical protein